MVELTTFQFVSLIVVLIIVGIISGSCMILNKFDLWEELF